MTHHLTALLIEDDEAANPAVDPYQRFAARAGETPAEQQARILRETSPGLNRNMKQPCAVAEYFGLNKK